MGKAVGGAHSGEHRSSFGLLRFLMPLDVQVETLSRQMGRWEFRENLGQRCYLGST